MTDRERSSEVDAAEAEKFRAEAEAAKADARRANAEAARYEEMAKTAVIEAEREQENRKRELAKNQFHHVYQFTGPVGETSVQGCIDRLTQWSRLDPKCGMEIVFRSPGGDVITGMALWDFLQSLRADGHELTTVAMGMAASMAGVLLQAGDHRIIGRESYLLIHEVSFSAAGSFGEMEDRAKWVEMMQDRIAAILSDRSTLSKTVLKRKWKRRDWWMDSDAALKYQFVDEVR